MELPTYVFVEMLIRISEFEVLIGEYLARTIIADDCIIRTTHGTVHVPVYLLQRQLINPESISSSEIALLAEGFRPEF
ncbi:hypothetical protein [Pedobacter sp. Bi36]|uniref:hypothetical protein n=1 Tax=Pedobacter sp. Bi36 TaxID=2822352 RepID=UPI001D34F5DC|nr:hypothetical protein [Pedobacter sp. Bi36]CAH0265326.1 hypothetical protein SRABI36_03581 [Pedobacter sp. Bi36]CAH0291751.1 hypothetical protein SRABI126_04075 [Pedobacter sp. Bi126]